MTEVQLPQVQTGHIGLNVSDLERSLQFYQALFGWELLRQSQAADRTFGFLGAAGVPVLTLWQQSAGRASYQQPGLHHLSFQVDGIAAVQAFEARLRELGVAVRYDGIVAHSEGAASGGLFFEDPDGIRLEIFTATGVDGHAAAHSDAPSCGFF